MTAIGGTSLLDILAYLVQNGPVAALVYAIVFLFLLPSIMVR